MSETMRDSGQSQGNVKKGDMHLVVQKGRTFQIENPNVRILLDKGRYLVVELHKSTARKLGNRKDPCFHIEPLRENSTAYETVPRKRSTEITTQRLVDIVSGVQKSDYEANLAKLVSFPTRFSSSVHYTAAANWASNRFLGLGLTSSVVPIEIPSLGNSANVIACKQGSGGIGRKNIVMTAHLDSVNHPGGLDAVAPGADDNASGASAVLSMAAALSSVTFTHDLTFVFFGGEEQGLHGSTQYLNSLSASEKANIHAVLNMDMIGSLNTTTPTVLLEGAPISQWMIDELVNSATNHTMLEIQTSLNPFASDHVPFLNAQIPAVLTIEGADDANDAIHTDQDTLDRVNVELAMEILRMNLGFVVSQAEIVVQSEAGCGCSNSDNDGSSNENVNVLVGHYQGLFAQYSRLHRDRLIGVNDYRNWQLAREMHDALSVSDGLTQITDQ
ncbi:MAG: Zn-dependent exopeptidase M28 [Proteobacteria bacterium]|nr:Zn-dependent exopeptidase M28 [Pseudomonadota bacterium]